MPSDSLPSHPNQANFDKILDSHFSVKNYFHELFHQLIPFELLQNNRMTVIDELIHEDKLQGILSREYPNEGYVLLAYAHRPHSNLVSPFNHDKNAVHTSLLLCKVSNKRVRQVLNIDGFDSLSYVDILGERPGAEPNPLIKHRLVITAPDKINPLQLKPLQSSSWENLNCPIYALVFAKALLKHFNDDSAILDNLFVGPTFQPCPNALNQLKNAIIQTVDGIYVKKEAQGGQVRFFRDLQASIAFHKSVRMKLAITIYPESCSVAQVTAPSPNTIVKALPKALPKEQIAPNILWGFLTHPATLPVFIIMVGAIGLALGGIGMAEIDTGLSMLVSQISVGAGTALSVAGISLGLYNLGDKHMAPHFLLQVLAHPATLPIFMIMIGAIGLTFGVVGLDGIVTGLANLSSKIVIGASAAKLVTGAAFGIYRLFTAPKLDGNDALKPPANSGTLSPQPC